MTGMVEMDVREALALRGAGQDALHARAGVVRDESCGAKVFVRGVVEVSNYCRENCAYCGMRRDNRGLARSRRSATELFEVIMSRCPRAVTDINIQAGEDPVAVREIVLPLVRLLRQHTGYGISVCLGTLGSGEYRALREAGADYYVIKLETGDPVHYRQVHAPGTFEERLGAIRHLAATGWHVSSGFILGLPGQTAAMATATIELLATLPLAGCSVSPFIAGEQTPFHGRAAGSLEDVLNSVALMRLASPRRFIPAVSAMELAEPGAYARALAAGANLATINLTPGDFRPDYLLYSRDRLIMDEQRVLDAISEAGLEASPTGISETLAGLAAAAAA
jgi:biotin synthase